MRSLLEQEQFFISKHLQDLREDEQTKFLNKYKTLEDRDKNLVLLDIAQTTPGIDLEQMQYMEYGGIPEDFAYQMGGLNPIQPSPEAVSPQERFKRGEGLPKTYRISQAEIDAGIDRFGNKINFINDKPSAQIKKAEKVIQGRNKVQKLQEQLFEFASEDNRYSYSRRGNTKGKQWDGIIGKRTATAIQDFAKARGVTIPQAIANLTGKTDKNIVNQVNKYLPKEFSKPSLSKQRNYTKAFDVNSFLYDNPNLTLANAKNDSNFNQLAGEEQEALLKMLIGEIGMENQGQVFTPNYNTIISPYKFGGKKYK